MKINDPLAVVQLYLQLNPNEVENRALRKLLQAIVKGDTTLYASETLLFQGELGALTAALLDANLNGQYSHEEWESASLI